MSNDFPTKEQFRDQLFSTEWFKLVLEDIVDTLYIAYKLCQKSPLGFISTNPAVIQKQRCKAVTHGLVSMDSLGERLDDQHVEPLADGSGGNLPTFKPHTALALIRWAMARGNELLRQKKLDIKEQNEDDVE